MKCEYCEIIERKNKEDILYEDDMVVIAVRDFTFTPGQITIFPKQHHTILEMVPEEVIQKCFVLANKVSMAIFETMGVQGTNIIVNNGAGAGQKIPHFGIEVVPRREGDGLNLQWNPKEISEDDRDTVYLMLKEEGDKLVGIGQKKEKKIEVLPVKEDKISGNAKDNYLIKSLKRVP